VDEEEFQQGAELFGDSGGLYWSGRCKRLVSCLRAIQTGSRSQNGSGRSSHAVELSELPPGFSLLAAFFDAGLFVVFTTLKLSFDPVNLKLFLQLPDGKLEVASNFNFYHVSLRFNVSTI
jgi:hypothetical protein